ncbi:KRE33 [Symbiodinium sp. CCMP2592]|nr:KRE33 [Symbiodinium sp. CCMP2592]
MLARQHRGLAALNVEPPNIRLLRKLSAIHSVEGTLPQPLNRPVAARPLSRDVKDQGPPRDQHMQAAGINGTEGRVSEAGRSMATAEHAGVPIRSAGAS